MLQALGALGFDDRNVTVVSDVQLSRLEALMQRQLNISYTSLPAGDAPGARDPFAGGPTNAGVYTNTILAAIRGRIEQSTPTLGERDERSLVVYFTGHGVTLREDTRYLAMPTSSSKAPETMLPLSKITHMIGTRMTGGTKLLVVDACAGTETVDADNPLPLWRERDRISMMFASELEQLSYYDRHLQRSVYTHYLLQALHDLRARQGITLSVVADRVRPLVATHVRNLANSNELGLTGTKNAPNTSFLQEPSSHIIGGAVLASDASTPPP